MYAEAAREQGITGENLLRMLELRLDNVVFRAGFSASRNQARQFVRHGHVNVNGKRVTIPSYQVKKDDVIEMAPKSQKMIVLRHNLDTIDRAVPMWLEADALRLQGGRSRPPATRADRRPCARTAHRRALLQVTPPRRSRSSSDQIKGAAPCSSSNVPKSRRPSPTATSSSSRSARSSPASATRSATACAARCSRRSPAPRSRRCASTRRCTSSTSSPA